MLNCAITKDSKDYPLDLCLRRRNGRNARATRHPPASGRRASCVVRELKLVNRRHRDGFACSRASCIDYTQFATSYLGAYLNVRTRITPRYTRQGCTHVTARICPNNDSPAAFLMPTVSLWTYFAFMGYPSRAEDWRHVAYGFSLTQ
jgi:hypothetical protein